MDCRICRTKIPKNEKRISVFDHSSKICLECSAAEKIAKIHKDQDPPTTDIDCKEKEPTGGERRKDDTRRKEGRGRERQGEVGNSLGKRLVGA